MITEQHYHDTDHTIKVIRHVIDSDTPNRISFVKILEAVQWTLEAIKSIFFDKMGKPKSTWQLVLSIPAIVRFAKNFMEMVNGEGKKKPTNEKKISQSLKDSAEEDLKEHRKQNAQARALRKSAIENDPDKVIGRLLTDDSQ